jgi:PAS domain S-box-containing protein
MNRILVVDNNPLMLEFMKEVLSEMDYEVSLASGGLDALHRVEDSVPDMVFVDLVMPQIDGKQLCRLFRANPKMHDTHIIIISGVAAENRDPSLAGLADAYIAKAPFKRMKEHIRTVMEDFERGNTETYRQTVLGTDELHKREITHELLYSKHHLEMLLSNLVDGFVEVTPGGEVIYANPAAYTFVDLSEADLIASHFPDFFSEGVRPRIHRILSELGSSSDPGPQSPVIEGEENPLWLNGRRLLLRFLPIRYDEYESVTIILQDITERKHAEEVIKNALEQKETLLKEVHHRVKNNLSVIASLLNLQSSHVDDEEVKKHLIESRTRVESMALVHERLSVSEDDSGIDLYSYIEGIIRKLIDVYKTTNKPMGYTVDMPHFTVTMELAIPLGLIVNELVSNSLEHAFTDDNVRENEHIGVVFAKTDGMYELTVTDNGVGFPEEHHFDTEHSESLGLLLASTLAEQIHGSLTITGNRDGVVATIRFPFDKWEEKIFPPGSGA